MTSIIPGLVDAPYALPPEGFYSHQRQEPRVYQGYCRFNTEVLTRRRGLRARRPSIEARVMAKFQALSDGTRTKALAFLGGFYDQIATDEAVTSQDPHELRQLSGGAGGRPDQWKAALRPRFRRG